MKKPVLAAILILLVIAQCKNKKESKQKEKKPGEPLSEAIEKSNHVSSSMNADIQVGNSDLDILYVNNLFDNDVKTGYILEPGKNIPLKIDFGKQVTIKMIRFDNHELQSKINFVPLKNAKLRVHLNDYDTTFNHFHRMKKATIAVFNQPLKTSTITLAPFYLSDRNVSIGEMSFYNGKEWFKLKNTRSSSIPEISNLKKRVENKIFNFFVQKNTTKKAVIITKSDFAFDYEKKHLDFVLNYRVSLREFKEELMDEYMNYYPVYDNFDQLVADFPSEYLRSEYTFSGYWELGRYSENKRLLAIWVYGNEKRYDERFQKGSGYYEKPNPNFVNEKSHSFIRHELIIDTRENIPKKLAIGDSTAFDLYYLGTRKKYTYSDLDHLSKQELAYLRNEFYARKGYKFKTKKMQKYFKDKPWYTPEHNDVSHLLSDLEMENIYFIKSIEEGKQMTRSKAMNSRIKRLYKEGQVRKLNKEELRKLNIHQLGYLRNTFYARKGYIFKTPKYKAYFSDKSWYEPKHKKAKGLLSDLEERNVKLIRDLEEQLRQ
jgi:hypothetical protein